MLIVIEGRLLAQIYDREKYLKNVRTYLLAKIGKINEH